MATPTTTGIGQGAAQVFDTRDVLGAFARVSMYGQQQRQLEEQALAKMMTQFDPTKLRAKDQPEFLQKYNELQTLYASNKGLYRNPLKFPQAYQQSQQLKNDLFTLMSESKGLESLFESVGKEHMKDPYKFSPDTVKFFDGANNMSVTEIKKSMEAAGKGYRLPTVTDFEYQPEELNEAATRKLVVAAAQSMGAIKDEQTYLRHAKGNNIPEYEMLETVTKKIDPTAMQTIAEGLVGMNVEFNRKYTYMNRHMTDEQRLSMETIMKEKFPDVKVDLKTPVGVATADLLSRYAVLENKSQLKKDQAAIIKHSDDRWWQGEKLKNIRSANAIAAADRRAEQSINTAQNMNDVHASQLVGYLANPNLSRQDLVTVISPLSKIGGYNKTLISNPNTAKSFEQYKKAVMGVSRGNNKDVFNAEGGAFNITEEDIKKSWDDKTPIYTMTLEYTPQPTEKDPNPTKQKMLYNILPTKTGTPEQLSNLMQVAGVGSKDSGFGIGNKMYNQVVTKKKTVPGQGINPFGGEF